MKGLGLLLALAGLLALLGTDGWAGCLAGWTSDGTIGITTLGRLVLFLRLLGGFALGLGLGLVLVGRPLVVVGRACWTSVVAEIKAWWMATRCVWNEMTLRERLALVFIVGVGALLRGLYLNLPIRLDEANSYITYISHPWLSVLGVVRYDPNNHPLYTCLAALSALLGGAREWVLRLPAFAAGVLLIPAVYLWGRQIAGSAAGLWGAALVAVCSPLVEYSVLARGYMLQTLLFLLMLIAAVRLTRHDCLGGWLLLVMLSGLGFFTMPSMLYGFGSVACWLFLTAMGEPVGPVRKRLILHLLLAAAVTGLLAILLYFPILVFSGPAAVLASKWTAPVPWYYFWTKWLDTLADIWRYLNRDLPGAVVVLLAVGFLYSQLRSGVLPKMRVPFSVAVLLGCAPLIFIQRVVPYTRVWLFLFPIYLGLAAAGWSRLIIGWLGPARVGALIAPGLAVLLVVGLGERVWRHRQVANSTEGGCFPDAEPLVLYLKPRLQAGDQILLSEPGEPVRYYLRRHGFSGAELDWAGAPPRRLFAILKTPGCYESAFRDSISERVGPDWGLQPLQRFSSAVLFAVTNAALAAP